MGNRVLCSLMAIFTITLAGHLDLPVVEGSGAARRSFDVDDMQGTYLNLYVEIDSLRLREIRYDKLYPSLDIPFSQITHISYNYGFGGDKLKVKDIFTVSDPELSTAAIVFSPVLVPMALLSHRPKHHFISIFWKAPDGPEKVLSLRTLKEPDVLLEAIHIATGKDVDNLPRAAGQLGKEIKNQAGQPPTVMRVLLPMECNMLWVGRYPLGYPDHYRLLLLKRGGDHGDLVLMQSRKVKLDEIVAVSPVRISGNAEAFNPPAGSTSQPYTEGCAITEIRTATELFRLPEPHHAVEFTAAKFAPPTENQQSPAEFSK